MQGAILVLCFERGQLHECEQQDLDLQCGMAPTNRDVCVDVDHDTADGESRRMMHYLRDWSPRESDGQVSFLFNPDHVLEGKRDEARPRLPKAVQVIPQVTDTNHPP